MRITYLETRHTRRLLISRVGKRTCLRLREDCEPPVSLVALKSIQMVRRKEASAGDVNGVVESERPGPLLTAAEEVDSEVFARLALTTRFFRDRFNE